MTATIITIIALLVVAATITLMMRAVMHARVVAESRAIQLERLNEEVQRVATRATTLLEVTTALSEAGSVEEVARVVLGMGLAVVEASRAILVAVDGQRLRLLGTYGMSQEIESHLDDLTIESKVPVAEAIRKGEMISVESAAAFREQFGKAYGVFAELSDMQTYIFAPLIHNGETVGGVGFHFKDPYALGAADRTFTKLLAQSAASALYRARNYDAERARRQSAETMAQAREDVLGIVAHDLRNPLNLILMTGELLTQEDLTPERRRDMLEIGMRAAKQMNRLIDDLLDTVRLQAGKLSLDVEEVSVDSIIRQAEETFRPLAERRRVKLEIAREDGGVVRADPT